MNAITSYFCWQRKYRGIKKVVFIGRHCIFSAMAYCLSATLWLKPKKVTPADIIILLRHKDSFNYAPIKQWVDPKYKVKVIVQPKLVDIFKQGLLMQPLSTKPFALKVYAAYARYFLETYQPKVVITENNGSLISHFIKVEAKAAKSITKTVHIAHSIPTDNYRKFSFINYDYYFLYGQSSIDKLNGREQLFGSCRCVITGSWLLEMRIKSMGNDETSLEKKNFILLGSGPDLELLEETRYLYDLVVKYISGLKEAKLFFKPHPRSDLSVWKELVSHQEESSRFQVMNHLTKEMGYFEVAFCAFTNAILDISKIGVTPILLTRGKHKDMFDYRSFIGYTVSNEEELRKKIGEVKKHKSSYQEKTKLFSEYHLGAVKSPSKFIGKAVNDIIEGNPPDYIELPEH